MLIVKDVCQEKRITYEYFGMFLEDKRYTSLVASQDPALFDNSGDYWLRLLLDLDDEPT